MLESRTGEIWVLGMEVGLFQYDEQLDSLICKVGLDCPKDGYSSGTQLSHGSIDEDGMIWAGTTSGSIGLFQYNTKNNQFNNFVLPFNEVGATAALADTILGLGKVIWIGTNDGIALFNPTLQRFYFFEGILPNKFYVYSIFKSKKNSIVWFCTNQGLIKFNPNNQSIQNYDLPISLNYLVPIGNTVQVIHQDKFQKEIYWIGLSRGGL
ncbi:MAG: hypothetical protein HC892_21165 [Saprospiraceae bacterium]|nr:hypothetical protein [Saprospiraceae bacterium]